MPKLQKLVVFGANVLPNALAELLPVKYYRNEYAKHWSILPKHLAILPKHFLVVPKLLSLVNKLLIIYFTDYLSFIYYNSKTAKVKRRIIVEEKIKQKLMKI